MNIDLFIKKLIGLKEHKIVLEYIRTPFGEPFDKNNHWVRTLKEYDEGIVNYKESTLYKFHQNFKPNNIFDVVYNTEIFKNDFFLGEYPWGRWAQKTKKEDWIRGSHCGPTSDVNIENEWNSFIKLYKIIKDEGLALKQYGVPLGLFLFDEGKQKYFIVTGGNHRMAIISYLKLLDIIPARAIARLNIKQFTYYNKLIIKYPRNGLNKEKSEKLFKNIISKEFVSYENK
jgi:hypothetical protein